MSGWWWFELLLIWLCPIVPVATAVLYAVGTATFNHMWSETPHGFPWQGIMWPRLVLLVATVAVATALSFSFANAENQPVIIAVAVAWTVLVSVRSWTWMVETRQTTVVGGPPPTVVAASSSSSPKSITSTSSSPKQKQQQQRHRVVVITGANTGIGKETARILVAAANNNNSNDSHDQPPTTVVLACRNRTKALQAKQEILQSIQRQKKKHKTTSNDDADDDDDRAKVVVVQADLSNLSSIRKAAQTLLEQFPVIDVLINNAGIMMGTHQTTTAGNGSERSHEMVFLSNHLGHYLWTRLLLPAVKKSNDGRILNVTSSTYTLAVKAALQRHANNNSGNNKSIQFLPLDDLECQHGRPYSLFGQYAVSKLSNIYFTLELTRRFGGDADNSNNNDDKLMSYGSTDESTSTATVEQDENTTLKDSTTDASTEDGNTRISQSIFFFFFHPGLVRTDVVRNMPWYLKYPNVAFGSIMGTLQKTPLQGAYCTLHVATAPRDQLLQQQQQKGATTTSVDPSYGYYWVNQQPQALVQPLQDHWEVVQAEARELWRKSAQLVGLSLGEDVKNDPDKSTTTRRADDDDKTTLGRPEQVRNNQEDADNK